MPIHNEVSSLEKKLMDIILFLKDRAVLIDAHVTNFITDNQWNYLNINMQNDLLGLAEEDLNVILSDDFLTSQRLKQFPYLCNFVQQANTLTLKEMGVCKLLNDVLPVKSTSLQNSSMNHIHKWHTKVKKQHEVQQMAFTISVLAKVHDINLVVDVGSGKGYLASYISHFHHLPVLGIEACSQKNKSAIIRNAKLSNMCMKQVGKNSNTLRHTDSTSFSSIKDNKKTNTQLLLKDDNYQNNRYICITKCISAASDLQNIIAENISDINSENVSQALPVVCYFSGENKDRKKVYKEYQNREKCSVIDNETSGIELKGKLLQLNGLLCGLHTCGNLAAAILKQFISCNLITVLCSIGCCYNLLTEEFGTDSTVGIDTQTDFGFPLSSLLRNMRFSLGRNARMLALQSKDRMSHKKLQQSLFYRSLLQVILHEHFAVDATTEIQVGRLSGKYRSFQDYVEKALTRLNFNHSNITSEKLEFYLHTYDAQEKKLQAFQMLRMVLAPCIETVIILDRLLYLYEQHSVKEAHLIQLFDPVISPRCYALIAVKAKDNKQNSDSKT